MSRISPLVKPSRIFHDVCAYWLISKAGFNPNAEGHDARITQASTIPGAMKASACACTFGIGAYLISKAVQPLIIPEQRTGSVFGLFIHTAALARVAALKRRCE